VNALNAVAYLTANGYDPADVVPVPLAQNAPAYGTDLSCVSDLDPSMAEVSGNALLAQACARRLLTPAGTLIDDASYGYDLEQFIDADIALSDVSQIQSAIQAELLKDQRVLSCTAVVTYTQATSVLTANIQITGASGPFSFVLTISQLAATITMAS
jgi:phage baseplate assembly protein W